MSAITTWFWLRSSLRKRAATGLRISGTNPRASSPRELTFPIADRQMTHRHRASQARATCGTYLACTISNAKARLCRNLMVNIGSSWCPATSALSPAVTTRRSRESRRKRLASTQVKARSLAGSAGPDDRRTPQQRFPGSQYVAEIQFHPLQPRTHRYHRPGPLPHDRLPMFPAVKAHERLLRVRSPAQYNYGSVPNAIAVRNRINALFKER